MAIARFLLVLSAQSNLVRAALVTRDAQVASSAHKTFQCAHGAFDPAEVWFQTKRVTAACFDIGRTQPRELAACVLVSDDDAWCVWQDNAGVVDAAGFLDGDAWAVPARFRERAAPVMAGTLRAWLLWNLADAYILTASDFLKWDARAAARARMLTAPRVRDARDTSDFGALRARSPFAATLALRAVFATAELRAADETEISADDLARRAAARAFALRATT
ncbi:MAG: hypothetical protein B6D41_17695 [Chloroflexi bacterium UTCFX4]|nr:MAG: hypothetical protein B6D41_17695 [Chloroflexi bacterium UTCFX4]